MTWPSVGLCGRRRVRRTSTASLWILHGLGFSNRPILRVGFYRTPPAVHKDALRALINFAAVCTGDVLLVGLMVAHSLRSTSNGQCTCKDDRVRSLSYKNARLTPAQTTANSSLCSPKTTRFARNWSKEKDNPAIQRCLAVAGFRVLLVVRLSPPRFVRCAVYSRFSGQTGGL